jgi:hypothetical protein
MDLLEIVKGLVFVLIGYILSIVLGAKPAKAVQAQAATGAAKKAERTRIYIYVDNRTDFIFPVLNLENTGP